jgi:hypothetical protein
MTERAGERETRDGGTEVKFLIEAPMADAIRQRARGFTLPDPHAGGPHGDEYQTTTIYFDTQALDVYWRRRSYGRSKLRIRRYGDATHAFVERKMRTGQVLAKRRTRVPLADLSNLQSPTLADWSGRWFDERLRVRRLIPICQVSYLRTARILSTEYGLARLTLDTDLRVLAADRPDYQHGRGALVTGVQTILELKFAVAMPATFKHLVEAFRLQPLRVSKYRVSLATMAPTALTAHDPGASRGMFALETSHA